MFFQVLQTILAATAITRFFEYTSLHYFLVADLKTWIFHRIPILIIVYIIFKIGQQLIFGWALDKVLIWFNSPPAHVRQRWVYTPHTDTWDLFFTKRRAVSYWSNHYTECLLGEDASLMMSLEVVTGTSFAIPIRKKLWKVSRQECAKHDIPFSDILKSIHSTRPEASHSEPKSDKARDAIRLTLSAMTKTKNKETSKVIALEKKVLDAMKLGTTFDIPIPVCEEPISWSKIISNAPFLATKKDFSPHEVARLLPHPHNYVLSMLFERIGNTVNVYPNIYIDHEKDSVHFYYSINPFVSPKK